MKKVLFVLMALLVASPAMAAPGTFTFGTPVTSTTGQVTIPWTATAGVVGISLKVNVTGGTATSVSVAPAMWFNVFMDSAFTIGETYTIGQGIPTATQTAAGELALGAGQAAFSICVGGLDDNGIGVTTGGEEAPTVGTIVMNGTAGATIAITEDTLRGGIVGYEGAMSVVTLPLNTAFGAAAPTEAVKSTAPFYNDWVAFGKPSCWAFQRQCRGDADGLQAGPYWVASTDLTVFKGAFNKTNASLPAGGICADFDHTTAGPYRVSSTDLTVFKAYFNKTEVNTPICDASNYNFWTN